MKITDTTISSGGVFRCCLSSVATEYLAVGEVEYSDRSHCKHCDREFELVNEGEHDVWLPVDMMETYNKMDK